MSAPELGGRRCQCRACGECFSRERAFDRHRVGRYAKPGELHGARRCLTVAEITARGWQRNAAGDWIMERMDNAGRSRIRAGDALPVTPLPAHGGKPRSRATPAATGRTSSGRASHGPHPS